ncbi:MAG: hypothetical protein F4X34_01435 [Chloroflexi bacterium]|nr:hypothetical protein [Chloroflexota bacterium]
MARTTNSSLPDNEERDSLEMDNDASDRPMGRPRHPVVAWAIASLRIIWSSLRHPGHPVWVDYRTGDVWLKRD